MTIARVCGAALIVWASACCPAASTGPAWPKSAGPQGDLDRDEKDAWQADGGTSLEPEDPATSRTIEGARLGPPPVPVEEEAYPGWTGETDDDDDDDGDDDGDTDDDDDVDLDELLETVVDGGELVIEL